jgi:hypothetical protein
MRPVIHVNEERIGHALTGSFTLDVCAHTLDWRENEEAAQKLEDVLAKAVADAEKNSTILTA